MLNKRVENGYVGIAFPLSFGAVSMVLVWWLRWGGLGAPHRSCSGRGTCGRRGDSLTCGGTLPVPPRGAAEGMASWRSAVSRPQGGLQL